MLPTKFILTQADVTLLRRSEVASSLTKKQTRKTVACENIRFSSLFAAEDVSRETSPAAKSEEKRMFSQARKTVRLSQTIFTASLRRPRENFPSNLKIIPYYRKLTLH